MPMSVQHQYTATYYNPQNHPYQATLLFSTVTLSIRYYDEQNFHQEIHWLAKEIVSLEERPLNTLIRYRNINGEEESLVIRDEETLQAIKKNFRQYKFAGSVSGRLFGSIASKLALAFAIFIMVVLAAYLWFIPWLGERIAMNFSKDTEIAMGNSMYTGLLDEFKVDSHKTTIVNEFYRQLNYNTGYPIQITVVESPDLNAFAIPGGHIIVYNALLDNMKTPEELAALLGHEASHIALRHSLRNIFRNLARKMFLALIFGNNSGIASTVINNADNLKSLEYSRELETEADDNGIRLMAENGINTEGMIRLMQLLQKENGRAEVKNFLSTHPVFEKRVEHIQAQLKKFPAAPTTNEKLKTIFHAIYENPAPAGSW